MNEQMPKMPKRVRVEEAENGYVVSKMDEKGNEKQMVCKNMEEMTKMVEEMMGEGDMKKRENYQDVKEKADKMAMKK